MSACAQHVGSAYQFRSCMAFYNSIRFELVFFCCFAFVLLLEFAIRMAAAMAFACCYLCRCLGTVEDIKS